MFGKTLHHLVERSAAAVRRGAPRMGAAHLAHMPLDPRLLHALATVRGSARAAPLPSMMANPLLCGVHSTEADQPPIRDMRDFTLDTSVMLSQGTFGAEVVNISSHDVCMATDNATGQKYAAKLMNRARVGFEGDTREFTPEEARRQAILEVLAMRVGNVLCPGQFPKAEVVHHEGNYYVVSKFIENAISVRDLRSHHIMDGQDRDESVFYLTEGEGVERRTKSKVPQEKLKLSDYLREQIEREGFTVEDALVNGRIPLKMALYILGETDETLNRDGNVLLRATEFKVDEEAKTITPSILPVAIDLGLCFGRPFPKEDLVDKAWRLAVRTKDSHTMGLELDGLPPTNLKAVKDNFLLHAVNFSDKGSLEKHLKWARGLLPDDDSQRLIDAMGLRMEACYLAGQLVKMELDTPEQ